MQGTGPVQPTVTQKLNSPELKERGTEPPAEPVVRRAGSLEANTAQNVRVLCGHRLHSTAAQGCSTLLRHQVH